MIGSLCSFSRRSLLNKCPTLHDSLSLILSNKNEVLWKNKSWPVQISIAQVISFESTIIPWCAINALHRVPTLLYRLWKGYVCKVWALIKLEFVLLLNKDILKWNCQSGFAKCPCVAVRNTKTSWFMLRCQQWKRHRLPQGGSGLLWVNGPHFKNHCSISFSRHSL